jgi:hypothetical protein
LLRSGGFLGCFGLLKKMDSGFVSIVSDEIGRFFEAKTAQRAARVYVPLPRHVLRLFVQVVRDDLDKRGINVIGFNSSQG